MRVFVYVQHSFSQQGKAASCILNESFYFIYYSICVHERKIERSSGFSTITKKRNLHPDLVHVKAQLRIPWKLFSIQYPVQAGHICSDSIDAAKLELSFQLDCMIYHTPMLDPMIDPATNG